MENVEGCLSFCVSIQAVVVVVVAFFVATICCLLLPAAALLLTRQLSGSWETSLVVLVSAAVVV